MSIIGQQKEIFEELRRLNPEVIEDGISDEDKYISSAYRIMYVLKEVNGGFGWSLCEHLRNGGRDQEHDPTWDNIARWTGGTDAAFTDACFKDEEIKWQTTARGVWYFKDGTTTVISFSHPAARVRDCYLYYALMDAIMEILK